MRTTQCLGLLEPAISGSFVCRQRSAWCFPHSHSGGKPPAPGYQLVSALSFKGDGREGEQRKTLSCVLLWLEAREARREGAWKELCVCCQGQPGQCPVSYPRPLSLGPRLGTDGRPLSGGSWYSVMRPLTLKVRLSSLEQRSGRKPACGPGLWVTSSCHLPTHGHSHHQSFPLKIPA